MKLSKHLLKLDEVVGLQISLLSLEILSNPGFMLEAKYRFVHAVSIHCQ